jgi:hypothetical protein
MDRKVNPLSHRHLHPYQRGGTAERPTPPTKLSPALARVLLGAFLAVVVAFLAAGCGIAPLPEGHRYANQAGAIELVQRWWGAPEGWAPNITFREPDCVPVGFVTLTGIALDGLCVWGAADSDSALISTRGQNKFSGTGLCHEALHLLIGDENHRDERWDTIKDCQAFLARNPDRDAMGEVVK